MVSIKLMAMLGLLAGLLDASTQPLDGVWRSQGWGYVFQIQGTSWQAFEVTSTTCVVGYTAKRQPGETAGREATFRTREGEVFFIEADADDRHKRVVRPTELTSLAMERLDKLPAVCAPPTANTPLGNFDVFARTFAEHYISFDLRKVDWERAVAAQRTRITSATTPAELFDILSGLIRPLADIHTGLEAPKLKRVFDAPLRAGTDRVVRGDLNRFEKAGRAELAAVTNRAYLSGRVRSFCRGQWQYGVTEDHIGYLRILGFGDYSRHGRFEGDLRALHRALDVILGDRALRGLVIDVRLSFGGDDRLGLAIAGRLTTHDYMAYAIQGRSDGVEPSRYSQPQRITVRPGKQPVFPGSVVELTGPITMSAAETFTQALMGRTPPVTRIGESTQGVFCDPLFRHLPNGWTFALPNAVYRGPDGQAFDVRGIPPDLVVPVFADEDVAAGRDPGMEAALRALTRK
ncbi:S41 family peptidase [uncultured Paludibaculum sp.]|uniref:S41 family peptidase n=1 Tax=uncultured Paludibaculum sp. TaxID=1765020 RepID=UPI002AAB4765|nr:S41 family peptidase [uncultured Paludibaculum sp.]